MSFFQYAENNGINSYGNTDSTNNFLLDMVIQQITIILNPGSYYIAYSFNMNDIFEIAFCFEFAFRVEMVTLCIISSFLNEMTIITIISI